MTKISQARQLVAEAIRASRASGAARIPGIHRLAMRSGLSPSTIHRAVAELRLKNEVHIEGRTGVFLSRPPPARRYPATPAPSRAWQRARDRILALVAQGRLPPGKPLPSITRLADETGVGAAGVRTALRSLEHDRVLQKNRRAYRVRIPASTHTGGVIVSIGRGYQYGVGALMPERTCQLLQFIDSTATQQAVSLYMLPYLVCESSVQAGTLVRDHVAPLTRRMPVLGFLFWPLGIQHAEVRGALRQLGQTGLPVACIDDHGTFGPDTARVQGRTTCVLTVGGGTRPGAIVGEYLHTLGHRHVAFVGHQPEHAWSQQRLSGLDSVFASRGSGDAVGVCPFVSSPLSRAQRSSMLDPLCKVLQGFGLPRDVPDNTRYRNLQLTLRVASERLIQAARDEAALDGAFSRALHRSAVTAWVAANDDIAEAALHFLRRNNVAVPGSISLVGFDDALSSLYNQISSYNFNLMSLARAALDFVLNPRYFRTLHRNSHEVQLDGAVTVRGTTARVRTK